MILQLNSSTNTEDSEATPIKCFDLDDISAQLKLEGWLYNVLSFYTLFNEEAPFYKQFGWGSTIL